MQSKGMAEALPASGGSVGCAYANAVGMLAEYSCIVSNVCSISVSEFAMEKEMHNTLSNELFVKQV
jgi:hypothetical protein